MVLLIMGWLGYNSDLGVAGQAPTTVMNMCWLVAGLYLFSAILMFVGIALVYNIDKPMLEKIKVELDSRRAQTKATAEEELSVSEIPASEEANDPILTETVNDYKGFDETNDEVVEETENPEN